MKLSLGMDRSTAAERYKAAVEAVKKVKSTRTSKTKGMTLEGTVFCFTGAMRRPRHQIISELERLGGTAVQQYRSSVNVVVAADPRSGTVKLQKARENRIPIISEDEYFKLIEEFKNGESAN